MSALDRVMMQKGRITQAFNTGCASYLEAKGWARVGKGRAKEASAKAPDETKTPAKPDAAKQKTNDQSKSEDS